MADMNFVNATLADGGKAYPGDAVYDRDGKLWYVARAPLGTTRLTVADSFPARVGAVVKEIEAGDLAKQASFFSGGSSVASTSLKLSVGLALGAVLVGFFVFRKK